MDAEVLNSIKEIGIAGISVLAVSYILYQVILNLRAEHAKNQEWFMGYVNENNHKVTDLVREVSQNIAINTESNKKFIETLERHTSVIEKLSDKIEKR